MATESSLSPEIRSLLKSSLSRRAVLAGVGGVAGATALAACGGGGAGSAKDTVRWANWTLYIDIDESGKRYPSLEAFTKKTKIKVDYAEDINDNDEFFGKVQGQLKLGKDIGYDLITPTNWMAARFIRLGYTQKFDLANIPNAKNVIDALAHPTFDPNREQSLPYQGVLAGIGWNKEKLPKGIHTLEELFVPANKGKIVVLSEMRDTIGVIMMAQGVDITKFTADQFMTAVEFLDKHIKDGYIRGVKGNEYKEDLISGDVVAGIVWSGDMFQLAAENDGKFDFAIPDSGGTISADNLLIPSTAGADGKKNAEALINYLYDPEVAAQIAAYVNYVTPVKGAQAAMEKINPDLVNSPLIFPSANDQKKLHEFRSLTPAEETEFTSAFQKAAGN